jgi:hypothetical protein
VLIAQQLWLARWRGAPLPPLERPPIASWRAPYAASHAALREYVAALTASAISTTRCS